MHRKLLALLVLLVFVFVVAGAGSPTQAQVPQGSKVYVMGSYFSNDGLVSDHHGGMSFGYQIKAWNGYIRTALRQIQFASSPTDTGDTDIEAIDLSVLLDLSISQRWSLYILGGVGINTDGLNEGLDGMIGLGADVRLWTFDELDQIPGGLNVFGEFVLSDAETANYFQFNLGLSYNVSVSFE